MKKLLLVIVCALMASTIFAQRTTTSSTSFFSSERGDQSVVVGVRAGLNFANMTAGEDDYTYSPASRTAFNVGISLDFPIVESLYLQSGLYLSSKGCTEDEITLSPMYLELPVLASYRFNFSEAAQLQLNIGPYFGFGIGGKEKDDGEKYDFFEDDFYSRFDSGLQFGAGVTLGKVYLGFAYQFGYVNLFKEVEDDEYLKNKNFMINVGFNF